MVAAPLNLALSVALGQTLLCEPPEGTDCVALPTGVIGLGEPQPVQATPTVGKRSADENDDELITVTVTDAQDNVGRQLVPQSTIPPLTPPPGWQTMVPSMLSRISLSESMWSKSMSLTKSKRGTSTFPITPYPEPTFSEPPYPEPTSSSEEDDSSGWTVIVIGPDESEVPDEYLPSTPILAPASRQSVTPTPEITSTSAAIGPYGTPAKTTNCGGSLGTPTPHSTPQPATGGASPIVIWHGGLLLGMAGFFAWALM